MAMMNGAVMAAAATVLGFILCFVLLYLVLERHKKTLIFVFLILLGGLAWFYDSMIRPPSTTLDLSPTVVKAETIRVPQVQSPVSPPPWMVAPVVIPPKACPPPRARKHPQVFHHYPVQKR